MVALAALASAALPGSAGAGFEAISVQDDFFAPDDAEDQFFAFRWDPGGDGATVNAHNVRQDVRLFRSGDPTTSGPGFDVTLSAGSFHYYCENHGSRSGGMDGFARRLVSLTDTVIGVSQRVVWSSESATTGNRYDVQFRVDGGRWRNWKVDTRKLAGTFGAGNEPVNVVNSKVYEVRARSQQGRDEDRRSGFSPPRTLFPE